MWVREGYYYIKPLIPRRLQILVRQQQAQSMLRKCEHLWPIMETAGKVPQGWAGWPNGKRFALVLTHDVDTERGQQRCPEVIDLESRLGFRSSFNFVPLRYPVSPELRARLLKKGFEVGVHGLYHDGKYYTTRSKFLKRAARINQFLREWKAVGYRAPSMLHKLDWFHDLSIEYDASTFDTDPFEPDSRGVNTIFPFFVSGRNGHKGYVELPYTMPQDFTVFILLQHQNIEIWKKKAAWIAEKGGMLLINTHPDYMHFRGNTPGFEDYPARYYEEFLAHIKSTYEGQYWHVLPRELARFSLRNQRRGEAGKSAA